MAQVLRPLEETFAGTSFDDVLVGLTAADDAAVYRISEEMALVVTVDFFTPIVDDPFAYGAIAAANSLSDIYAMGARPILGLNIAALPKTLPLEISAEILRGGAEKALEAGIPVAGGHTISDDEPKYGLVVLGTIDPSRLTHKGGAQAGDRLLLSKPLGTGVVTTALMQGQAAVEEVEQATASMMQLNRSAADLARQHRARAVTDVTGFGLLGHAAEMAQSGSVRLEFSFDKFPWLPGAQRLGRSQVFPGGAATNQEYFDSQVELEVELEDWQEKLLFSPETSGGLLMALPEEAAGAAVASAESLDLELVELGVVRDGEGIGIVD